MKKILIPTLFILFAMAFSPLPALGAASPAAAEAGPTLDECLALALENHPDMASANTKIRRSVSQTKEAAANLRPTVDVDGSVSTNDGTAKERYSSGIGVSHTLSDGGRRELALKKASVAVTASERDATRTRQVLLYDVKQAFFSLLRYYEDVSVAQETVSLYEAQLAQARAFYDAGRTKRSDVTTAEVNLSQAKQDLTKAKGSLSIGWATLENTVGTKLPRAGKKPDVPTVTIPATPAEEAALNEALSLRPDYLAQQARIIAAGMSVSYAAKGMNPTLSLSGGYDFSDGHSGWSGQWSTALTLSIPVSDGGATAAKTETARADLDLEKQSLESIRQTVLLEVRTALSDLATAEEQVVTAGEGLRQAKENMDLAVGRYGVGVGTSLEVSDAGDKYNKARKSLVQANFDLQIARATLEKVLGRDTKTTGAAQKEGRDSK